MGRFAVYAAFAIGLSCEAAVSEDARIISETKLPSTEQIRKNGQNLAAQQLAARQKLLSRSPAGHLEVRPSAAGITNANCVTITLIDLRGVTLLSEEERIEILKPYVQQCIGLKSIDELMRDVTRVYFSKGYLAARVYLPPQRIEDGQLDLQIEEGVVEALTFNGDFERKQGTLQALFPDHIGKPVNLRTVEQGIEFINRLPSSRAAIELVAGTKPGHTIINLKDAPERPVRFSMSTDNEGTKSSGVIGTKYNATLTARLVVTTNCKYPTGLRGRRRSNLIKSRNVQNLFRSLTPFPMVKRFIVFRRADLLMTIGSYLIREHLMEQAAKLKVSTWERNAPSFGIKRR